jgi:hypothetical protein
MTKPIEEEPLEDEEEEEPIDDDEDDDEEEGSKASLDHLIAIDHLAVAPVTVTGQVTDSTGINWPFAVLQFSLVIPSGQIPVDLSTGLEVPNPAPIIAGSTALFTMSLLPNTDIVPATQWQLTVFPFNNMMVGQTLPPFFLTAGRNLTAAIAAFLNPFPIGDPFLVPLSHNAAVGRSSFNGSMYFDVVAQSLFVRNPATGTYIDIGGVTLPDPLIVNAIQATSIAVSGAAIAASLTVSGNAAAANITLSGTGTFVSSPTATTMSTTLANAVDLNTVRRSGEYVLSNPVNGPAVGDPSLLYLKVMCIGDSPPTDSFIMQFVWDALIDNHFVYSRKLIGATWFPWAEEPN